METKKLYALNREGTCQSERFPEALSDEYVKIDERTLADLVKQSAEYARYVKYYNDNNIEEGKWKAFFEEIYEYPAKPDDTGRIKFSSIEELESKASTSPHLALFLAFLRLFGIAQENLNTLTKKHLDFYYKEILQIKPKLEKPDRVPLFFELSKPAQQVMVTAGTLFQAGKDKNGKPLYYATKNDLIVNKAKIEDVKGVFKKDNGEIYVIDKLLTAPRDNTSDSNTTFLGIVCEEKTGSGLALASPMFNLKDGDRTIKLRADKNVDFSRCLNAKYSSVDGWKDAKITPKGLTDANTIEIKITPQDPPLVPYEESLHQAGFDTTHPVIRLTKKEEEGAAAIEPNTLKITKLTVDVKGTQDFIVRGDNGILNHRQAFLPFGSNPVPGASLRIENANIFNEFLNTFTAKIEWKGPEDLATHYSSYDDGKNLKPSISFNTNINYNSLTNFGGANVEGTEKNGTIVTVLKRVISNPGGNLEKVRENGFAETKLNQDMGYSVFSSIYSGVALKKAVDSSNGYKFPKPPYIPEIKSVSLNYTAVANNLDYSKHDIFNINSFGSTKLETEESSLKNIYNNSKTEKILLKRINRRSKTDELLMEDVDSEGEILIGIGSLDKSSVLSLYFRLGEACNPDKNIEDNRPVWLYLKNNDWIKFKDSEILGDSTCNFTRSGVVYLNVPDGAFTAHTIMPDGKVWLKLAFKQDCDMFPSLESIETQVVEASFVNRDNELSHLEKGIPAETISKPMIPIQGIKSVIQPYPSSGGRGIEEHKAFYTRVSERLRHKERAWNVWDYERLILENFPEVFKVKCIPNANPDCSYSPGDIFIVLIPDCKILPQRNIYEPLVSRALIDDVRSFVKSHCSPFVEVFVGNPNYERIQVICEVEYAKDYSDRAYYKNLLSEDLKAFLAPWTSDPANFIFNRTLSKSQILYFIEKRPYVDYVDITEIAVITESEGNSKRIVVTDEPIIRPFSLNGILTTSDEHYINNIE